MKSLGLTRYAVAIGAAAAMLAGCGGSQPPIGAPGAMLQGRAIATQATHGKSWMLPEAKGDTLLYVSTDNSGVYVYAYPSGKLVGILYDGFTSPEGMCVDKKGNIFIANTVQAGDIVEFAHGGSSPIASLYDNQEEDFSPFDCSIDPINGNLAATNLDGTDVAVYRKARGKPKNYPYVRLIGRWCGYDGNGNLFVDLLRKRPGEKKETYIAELPRGSSAFQKIKLSQHLFSTGALVWDGSHMTIGNLKNVVYRLSVSGSTGTIIGNTQLSGVAVVGKYWFQGSTLIGPVESSDTVSYWKYPVGGQPFNVITGAETPLAAVVSRAK